MESAVPLILPLPGWVFYPALRAGGLVLLFSIDLTVATAGAYFSPARKVAKARQNLRFWTPL